MRNFEQVLKLEPGRTAPLVVDMQRGFLDPGEALEVPQAREIVPAIQRLLAVFRSRRLPVVFTEFVYSERVPLLVGDLHPEHKPAQPGAPTGFGLPSSNCLEGHPSAETIPALAPRPDELVVRKHGYDAFHGTPLDGALRARGVTSLVVTGTLTDICVLASMSTASRWPRTPSQRSGRRSSGPRWTSLAAPSDASHPPRTSPVRGTQGEFCR